MGDGGDVISRILVLGSTRKHIDQAIMSKRVSTTPLWSLYQLLSSGPAQWWIPVLTTFNEGLLMQKFNPLNLQQASGCVVFPTALKPLLRKIPCRLEETKSFSMLVKS